MAHKEGAGRGYRDPRLNRRRDDFVGHGHRDGGIGKGFGMGPEGQRSIGPEGRRHGAAMTHRAYEGFDGGSHSESLRRIEHYDYGHKRFRSPHDDQNDVVAQSKKPHCDIMNESIQVTVGNDKFRSPFTAKLETSTSAAGPSLHSEQDFAKESASVARAREMAVRTREMLSKLTGWNPLRLQPESVDHTKGAVATATTSERPNFVNISNSAYTKVSASSEVAQTILQNINAVAAAFCPKESGGVAHFKFTGSNPPGVQKSMNDDEDKFLYGEELVPKKAKRGTLSAAFQNQLKQQSSPLVTKPPVRKAETDADCDPVVANVLKSIGFNFELSKIMQEKAKKEREENEKNRLLIQQASSFLAKQLGKHSGQEVLLEEARSLDKLTRVVINDDAKAGKNTADELRKTQQRKDKDIYDDFSNSEDELCGSAKKKWTDTAAETDAKLTAETGWQSASLASTSLSPGLSFVPAIPTKTPIIPTASSSALPMLPIPPTGLPLPATVQPPVPMTIPVPPPPVILPPAMVLQPPPQPTFPHQPMWPTYQMPLSADILSKQKPVSHTNEVEWEQNTEDFLRRLKEPRGSDVSTKREFKPSSIPSSLGSCDGERGGSRLRKKRSSSRELSRSLEQKEKQRKCSYDRNDQKSSLKSISFLRDKLDTLKKEHSQLMRVRHKNSQIREKLKHNRRQQDELNNEIYDLSKKTNSRNNARRPSAADGDDDNRVNILKSCTRLIEAIV